MKFDPQTNKFPYTKYTDEHYLKVNMNRGFVFDENYPYIDDSKKFKNKQKWIRFLLNIIVFPVISLRMGLKIKGRKNLKIHKEELKNGAITVCNHIHMCDYIGIMKALRPHKTNVLVWAPNVNGESGPLVRLTGGIPIPEDNFRGTIAYLNAIEKLLDNKGWLQVYSEGSMWEYYAQIRPFKKGAAYFAIKANKPIVPLAYSYRKPCWIRRVIFRQIACFTLTIGEPLYPNQELSGKEQELELTKRCHEAVCLLSGTSPADNLYPPIFNHNERIDYYTDEYGVGYKKSW